MESRKPAHTSPAVPVLDFWSALLNTSLDVDPLLKPCYIYSSLINLALGDPDARKKRILNTQKDIWYPSQNTDTNNSANAWSTCLHTLLSTRSMTSAKWQHWPSYSDFSYLSGFFWSSFYQDVGYWSCFQMQPNFPNNLSLLSVRSFQNTPLYVPERCFMPY